MKKFNFLLLGILIIGIFFRFYQFGSIPSGLTNDEADIGYDAYSILLTGKDQWGQMLPLTSFRGFGDYRPALYTYLVVPFVKLFGLSSISVRFPSAIFGSLSILAIYLLIKKLFGQTTGLAAAFIFAISPWSIGLSRIGIESNVAIFFILISLNFFVRFRDDFKNLFLASLFLVISVYTYSAYTLFALLFVIPLLLFYHKDLLKLKQKLMYVIIFIAILLLPIVIKNISASTRFSQVGLMSNINSIGLIDNLNAERGACLKSYPSAICKIIDNKPVLFLGELSRNYLAHFSPNFLFFTGSETQYSILPKQGFEYPIEIIFLVSGLFFIIKSRKREGFLLLSLFLLSPIPDALTGDGNYSRASIMLPFLVAIESIGLSYLYETIKSWKNKIIIFSVSILGIVLIVFGLFSFFVTYSTYFKDNYSSFSQYGYELLMKDVYADGNLYDDIYITRHLNDTKQYIYYLFYNKYNPVNFQNKKDIKYSVGSDGWVDVSRIGNIHFVGSMSEITVTKSLLSKNVLFIGHPTEFAPKVRVKHDIVDKTGTIKFREVDLKDLKIYVTVDQNTNDLIFSK